MKKYCYLILLFFFFNKVSAQEFPADKRAFIINGTVSMASYGGKLYSDGNNKRNSSISISPSVDYFLKRNIFLGSSFLYYNEKFGADKKKTYGIGPEIGYVLGKPESKIFPVLSVGYLFTKQIQEYVDNYGNYDYEKYGYGYPGYGGYGYNPYNYTIDRSANGNEIFLAIGIILPVQKHIGVTVGGVYRYQNYKSNGIKTSGNIMALSLGISGLLYRSKADE